MCTYVSITSLSVEKCRQVEHLNIEIGRCLVYSLYVTIELIDIGRSATISKKAFAQLGFYPPLMLLYDF